MMCLFLGAGVRDLAFLHSNVLIALSFLRSRKLANRMKVTYCGFNIPLLAFRLHTFGSYHSNDCANRFAVTTEI